MKASLFFQAGQQPKPGQRLPQPSHPEQRRLSFFIDSCYRKFHKR